MSYIFNKLVLSVRDENQKMLSDKTWGVIIRETTRQVKAFRQMENVNSDDFASIVNDLISHLKDNNQFLTINDTIKK